AFTRVKAKVEEAEDADELESVAAPVVGVRKRGAVVMEEQEEAVETASLHVAEPRGDSLTVNEETASADLEVTEEVEEEVEAETATLELETTPMEVQAPIVSPVISSVDELNGELNGMSVVATAEEKVLTEDQIEEKLQEF